MIDVDDKMLPFWNIDHVNTCKGWLAFRQSIRGGKSTGWRLAEVAKYLDNPTDCCSNRAKALQVTNYLNGLIRGSWIKRVEDPLEGLLNGTLEVLK